MEVLTILLFSPGLAETATAIIGAYAGGLTVPVWSLVLSCISLVVLSLVLVTQLRRLVRFYREHIAECWLQFEPPTDRSDVDDPLLALLCRLGVLRPRARDRGAFLLPAVDSFEPHRTELALAEAFNCGLGFRRRIARKFFNRRLGHYAAADVQHAGYKLERLQSWLGEGNATPAGIAFQAFRILIQLCVAINTGFLFAHPFRVTTFGQQIQLGVNVGLLALGAVFTGLGTASDLWQGLATSVGYALEAGANALMLASVLLAEPGGSSSADNATNATSSAVITPERVALAVRSVQLAELSATLLTLAIFAPLLLVAYDATIVPFASYVMRKNPGTPAEVFCTLLAALVVVPLQAIGNMLGLNLKMAGDVVEEYKGTLADVTSNCHGSALHLSAKGDQMKVDQTEKIEHMERAEVHQAEPPQKHDKEQTKRAEGFLQTRLSIENIEDDGSTHMVGQW